MSKDITKPHLLPVENMTLTIAKAQIARGENPPINTTTMLVMALERITGKEDYTTNPVKE